MNTEQEINDYLASNFGRNYQGLANFRVAWSDTQREMRRCEYEEQYHGIFLRHIIAMEECKKYPIIKERWILEKLIPPDPCYTKEIVSAQEFGSYECIYIFQDKDKNYLPLNKTVASIIVQSLLEPGSIGKRTDSSELMKFEEEKKEEDNLYNALMDNRELALHKDMKYPDGTRANLNMDGMKVFIPEKVE